MRIGLNLMGIPETRTGVHRYAMCLVRALVGIDPTNEYIIFGGSHITEGLLDTKRVGKVTLPSKGRVDRRYREQVVIPGLAQAHKVDVLHSLNNVCPVAAPARNVVTVHDIMFKKFPRKRFRGSKSLYYRVLVPLSLRKAHRVICVSDNTLRDVAQVYKVSSGRLRRVYNGVSSDLTYSADRVIGDPYMLFVGSIEPIKNLLKVIEAYSLLVKKMRLKHVLVLAGPRDWASSDAAELACQLGVQHAIILPGEISNGSLRSLYQHADLFVFPSLYEGFGLPVLEAMACGTPVVTSNTSSLPEVAGDAALLVDPENVQEIAGAMERVLTDQDLRAELSRRGRERAKLFTWERCAQETLKVYEEVYKETR
jgi:glycosyltransferase involved in cell wall biosynthesis